jgi:polar amino acid transport system permease protein
MTTEEPTDKPPTGQSKLFGPLDNLVDMPWWLLLAIGVAMYAVFLIVTDEQMRQTFWFISGQKPRSLAVGQFFFRGILVTLTVTISAYSIALVIGLVMGLMRSSSNVIAYNISSLYVEIVRGIPMLVLLLYIAFALTPLFVDFLNRIGIPISTRDIPNVVRAIAALAIGYGAFTAEIFRAGIQSIEKGQFEASSALGMSYFQTMRLIILPQAVRRILPALGNDFIAMVKDSSLVAILGVQDLTQLTRLYYSSNFLYMQSLTMLAFMYLLLVVSLTRVVRLMEVRLQRAYAR